MEPTYTLKNESSIDSVTYLWKYDDIAQEIMSEGKYKSSYQLLNSLAPHIFDRLSKMSHPLSSKATLLLLPIPADRIRYLERGFDHTKIIAKQFSIALNNLEIENEIRTNLLVKSRHSNRQASLSRDERFTNMIESLRTDRDIIEDLDGKDIVLIDDVMTTGATIFEAVRCIKKVRPDLNISGLTLFRGHPLYSPDLKADHTPTAFRLFVS